MHINASSGQAFNLQRFWAEASKLTELWKCVRVCVCVFVRVHVVVRMLYNDHFSVLFPNPGWKQTVVILDRFLNESWWLVFGDLLRPSLLHCLLSARLHLPTNPLPHRCLWLPHNKLGSHRSPSICFTPGIPWIKLPLPHHSQQLHIIKARKTVGKVSATSCVTELKRYQEERETGKVAVKDRGWKKD